MNKNTVHRKTAKGLDAIATRQGGLTPRQRSILILVDGKRNFDELAKLSSAFGDPEQLLVDLEAGGFIEPAGGAGAATTGGGAAAAAPQPASAAVPAAQSVAQSASPLAAAPAPAFAASAPAAPGVPLADARRFAVRKLTDILGPVADDLCMRIEAARTAADYDAAIARAQNVLREVRGNGVATRFMADIADHRPAG